MAQGLLRAQQALGNRLKKALSHPRSPVQPQVHSAQGAAFLVSHQRSPSGIFQNRGRTTLTQVEQGGYELPNNAYPTNNAKLFQWIDTPNRKLDPKVNSSEVGPAKQVSLTQSLDEEEPVCSLDNSGVESSKDDSHRFWSAVPQWSDIAPEDFNSQYWQVSDRSCSGELLSTSEKD